MYSLQEEVQEQIHTIHKNRNRYIWIPNLLLIGSSTYFQREFLFKDNYWWVALGLVLAGILMRALFFNGWYDAWRKKQSWSLAWNYASLLVLTSGWLLHFWDVSHHYGVNSSHLSNTLIFIAGLIAGANVSLGCHPRSFYLYASLMCLGPLCIYLLHPESESEYVSFYILVFYFFNISSATNAFKQLKRSVENEIRARIEKDHLSWIIDSVPGYVVIVDQNLVCVGANKTALENHENILGKRIDKLEFESGWPNYVMSFFSSNKLSSVDEAHFILKGKETWTLRQIHRTSDKGAILVSMDITDLVQARKQLREQEAKAQYSAKLASLGEMAAGIAHEINNPLTILQGAAQIIQVMVQEPEIDRAGVNELTEKLVHNCERISKTVKSMKILARNGEEDPFLDVDLKKVIDQCLEVCWQRFHLHGVDVRLPDFKSPVYFKGREVQISQVFVNLFSNAFDAIKDQENPWVKVDCIDRGEKLEILVSDSGPGVPAKYREKIMEPFFTTKDINKGTGLGLSISKSIVQSHHGELTLLQNVPHTTFKISLPKI